MRKIPQVVPFSIRINLFSELLREDHQKRMNFRMPGSGIGITIRRDQIYEGSYDIFSSLANEGKQKLRSNLKSRFQVTFVNELGLREAGIDGYYTIYECILVTIYE